jgi:DUF971 family protein
MSYSAAHTPNQIVVNSDKDTLSLGYADGTRYTLAAEYLRILSPSAEVRGHGTGQEVLQFGKRHVKISAIAKSGNYAIQITFSDGHNSGLFTWDYLRDLAINYQSNWDTYLETLQKAGKSRDPDTQVVKLV